MPGFLSALKGFKLPKMNRFTQFILILGILVVSLVIKNVWHSWFKYKLNREGFTSDSNELSNVNQGEYLQIPYYNNTENKTQYAVHIFDSGTQGIFYDKDNGYLIDYTNIPSGTSNGIDAYSRYGAKSRHTDVLGNGAKISTPNMQSIYEKGYVRDISDVSVAYVPFGVMTLMHVFDASAHIRTVFVDTNKNIETMDFSGDIPPVPTETFTTLTTVTDYPAENLVYRLESNVYLDPSNGHVILQDENDASVIYSPRKDVIQYTSGNPLPATKRSGMNCWVENVPDTNEQKFVMYADNGTQTMLATVVKGTAGWKIGSVVRYENGKVKTSDDNNDVVDVVDVIEEVVNETHTVDNDESSSSNKTCGEGNLQYNIAGGSLCIPTNIFYNVLTGGIGNAFNDSSNGYSGSEFIRKTQIVPPVCPQCPQCPSGGCGKDGVCTNCGGNGGSGSSDGDGKSIVRAAGDGATSLVRDAGSNARDLAREAAHTGVDVGRDVVGGTVDIAKDTVGGTVDLAKDVVGETKNIVGDVAGETKNLVSDVAGSIGSGLGAVGSGIGNLVTAGGPQGQNQGQGSYQYPQGQGYANSYGGPHVSQNVPPGMDPYSYYGAVPPRGNCNFMPRTADFSSFGR